MKQIKEWREQLLSMRDHHLCRHAYKNDMLWHESATLLFIAEIYLLMEIAGYKLRGSSWLVWPRNTWFNLKWIWISGSTCLSFTLNESRVEGFFSKENLEYFPSFAVGFESKSEIVTKCVKMRNFAGLWWPDHFTFNDLKDIIYQKHKIHIFHLTTYLLRLLWLKEI